VLQSQTVTVWNLSFHSSECQDYGFLWYYNDIICGWLGTNILEEESAISIFRLQYLPTKLDGVTFYHKGYENLAVWDHLMWRWE
jgi:hypothetical protein